MVQVFKTAYKQQKSRKGNKVYQQALELVKVCNARLTEAEQQVKLIVEQEDGTVEFKDFKPIDGDRNSFR